MDIFETASRKKFRFPSIKGDLTAEQLWDLPLAITSPTRDLKADLDTVARGINADLRSVTEESFVAINPDPRKADLEAKLDIVKHIIGVKQAEIAKAVAAAGRDAQRRKLAEALANKQDQALASLSEEEILKKLAELDVAA